MYLFWKRLAGFMRLAGPGSNRVVDLARKAYIELTQAMGEILEKKEG
jgi:hypothetical protein